MRKGADAYRAKKFADAESKFRDAARRDPEERAWNFDLGTAAAAGGKSDDARRELTRAAQSADPAVAAKASYQLGTLDLQEKNYPQAVQELRRSLELTPRDPNAKRNFELALREQHKKPPQQPKPKPGSQNAKGNPAPRPENDRDQKDSEFRKNAGMSRAEAEAMLRSLENEQKQRERTAARAEGKDW